MHLPLLSVIPLMALRSSIAARLRLCRVYGLAILVAPGLAWAAATPQSPSVTQLELMRAADLRVAMVGERLAMANRALCSQSIYRSRSSALWVCFSSMWTGRSVSNLSGYARA